MVIRHLNTNSCALLIATTALLATGEAACGQSAAPYNWTGPFVGAQFGYAWDGEQIYAPYDQNALQYSVNRNGVFGGLNAGYDYQFSNGVVLGAEAGYNIANVSGNATVSTVYATHNRVTSFGSVDLKLGYAFDRFLVYGIGGVGFGGIDHSITLLPGYYSQSDHSYPAGYTVGGGVQYAFTSAWSAFVEYRYYNFGKQNWAALPVLGPHTTEDSLSNVRIGVSYKIGG